ncbi:hypothetical protein E1193_25930 [Micromonospora sp. KC606]|nr:hypothetical protein E1193_25930 [Micromonospora sp. KC606]
MRGGTGYRPGPQTEALRQIVVQNYYRDAAGRLRWRTADDGGLPPSSSATAGSTCRRRPGATGPTVSPPPVCRTISSSLRSRPWPGR